MSTGHGTSLVYRECPAVFSVFDWRLDSSLKWMEENWHYSAYASIVYMLVVFSLERTMRTREPFKLRRTLAAWNVALTVFSGLGSWHMADEMGATLFRHGLDHSVCIASVNPTAQYVMWLFALSKIFELGDTVFVVLRKQKLIFLHWFHHILALVYTWYSYGQNISLGRWFVAMNLFVHTLMYGYYALRALQVYVPRQVAMLVTSLQILQMVLGFYVSSHAFVAKLTGHYCEIPMFTATFGFAVYVVFFLMFAKLFVDNYIYVHNRKGGGGGGATSKIGDKTKSMESKSSWQHEKKID